MEDLTLRTRFSLGIGAILLVVLLVTLVIYWLIPSHPKTTAELCGTYVADHKLVRDEFTLRADGSFVQSVTIKATSAVASSRGTWTYNPSEGYVTFYDGFLRALDWPDKVDPNYARPWPVVSYPVEYRFGRLVVPLADGRQEWWKVRD
jgi:hypothetical protein